MNDLIAAIRAAIDGAERIAQASTPGPWRWASRCPNWGNCMHAPTPAWDDHTHLLEAGEELVIYASGYEDPEVGISEADAAHIAHHDPAAVLRRCKADRKILDWAERCEAWMSNDGIRSYGIDPSPDDLIEALAEAYCIEVR